MSRSMPSRALDAVYDPVYAVSHSGGSFRKGTYRPSGVATAAATLKATSGGSSNNNPTEGYAHVSGPERVKFFQRPILPYLLAEPPEVLLAPVPVPAHVKKRIQEEDAGPTRSVGVQTMFRDSEAQTDAYTPDFTVKKSLTGQRDVVEPEILSLLHLRQGAGQLPAGKAEIELIERNRKKKAFEASLPPMTDEASFLLRKTMMETQETREWAYREAEIDALHEQRISLLQQALEERDKENEFLAEQRIEALRQRLQHEKENALERIQQERVSALRKLTKKRQHGHLTSPKRELKRDIIGEYADFSSHVYAPVTRGGKSGKAEIREVGIEKDAFQQLDVLREFETIIPPKMLLSTKQKPSERVLKTAKDRKQAAVEAHLLKMESIIKKSKEKHDDSGAGSDGGSAAGTLLSRKRAQQQQQQLLLTRPPTPDYAVQSSDSDEQREDAVRLLQKLVRGRAVQNMMFEGKERRAELIAELRASDEAAAEHAGAVQIDDEETRVARATMHKAEGEIISEMLDFLYKELDRSKEIAKQKAFVDAAFEQRRRREVEEGGRRQAEEMLRDREDEVFRRIERVHQETAMDYIDDLVGNVIVEQALAAARDELHVLTDALGPMVTALEARGNPDEMVVKELVASFLLPHVQRQHVRDQLQQEEKKFVTAAHTMLTEMVSRMSSSPSE